MLLYYAVLWRSSRLLQDKKKLSPLSVQYFPWKLMIIPSRLPVSKSCNYNGLTHLPSLVASLHGHITGKNSLVLLYIRPFDRVTRELQYLALMDVNSRLPNPNAWQSLERALKILERYAYLIKEFFAVHKFRSTKVWQCFFIFAEQENNPDDMHTTACAANSPNHVKDYIPGMCLRDVIFECSWTKKC